MQDRSPLVVRVEASSAVARQLQDEPPAAVDSGDLVVEFFERPTPPKPMPVVMQVPSPEDLASRQDQLIAAVLAAGEGDEPLVINVDSADRLGDDAIEAALAINDSTMRSVILTVLDDG